MGYQFQLLATIYSITQAHLSAAINSDKTKDTQLLRRVLAKTTLRYMGLQARSTGNLLFASWEPDFRYQFPKSVYSNLLTSMQR